MNKRINQQIPEDLYDRKIALPRQITWLHVLKAGIKAIEEKLKKNGKS